MNDLSSPFMNALEFGPDFKWGIASSAYQTEAGNSVTKKDLSHWDRFLSRKGIPVGQNGAGFEKWYSHDLELARSMGFKHFRFSLRWPRLMPEGSNKLKPSVLDFYQRLADVCQAKGLQLWLTLYHWDLPDFLAQKGGWSSYKTVKAFLTYAEASVNALGDRVAGWVILNEPIVFTGAGYGIGAHAPGQWGLKPFLQAYHHAMLAMAEASHLLKAKYPTAYIGSSFSQTPVEPWRNNKKADHNSAKRVFALLNKLCLDPALGYDIPVDTLPFLNKLSKLFSEQAISQYHANLDFIGIQPYTREFVKYSPWVPFVHAWRVSPYKRQVPRTAMGWAYDPGVLKAACQRMFNFPNLPDLYITECGVAFKDRLTPQGVEDGKRIHFFRHVLKDLLTLKKAGLPVKGFFVWTLTDNFEWMERFQPRFGLVYVNYCTEKRHLKASGKWFGTFLNTTKKQL